jgi:putative chitinase
MLSRDEFLKVVAGANATKINAYYEPLMNAMSEFGIDTKKRQVMFLAQVMTESGSLSVVVENLNYSAPGLRNTFGKYYRTDAEAAAHARQPIKIASRVYANRMGNGDERSQEGWKYRGRGLIQITGKNNYDNFGESIKMDIDSNVGFLETPEGAARSAAWFWDVNNLNRFADAGDIVGCSKAVNGGTNGLEERKKFYARGMQAIAGSTDEPVPATFTTLTIGSSGDNVAQVQTLLGIDADGRFGPGTAAAVKEFQRLNGLTVDGVVGPKTFELMKK